MTFDQETNVIKIFYEILNVDFETVKAVCLLESFPYSLKSFCPVPQTAYSSKSLRTQSVLAELLLLLLRSQCVIRCLKATAYTADSGKH